MDDVEVNSSDSPLLPCPIDTSINESILRVTLDPPLSTFRKEKDVVGSAALTVLPVGYPSLVESPPFNHMTTPPKSLVKHHGLVAAFTDGGYLPSSYLMSGAFLWFDLTGHTRFMLGSELHHPVPSNNIAEILAACNCLKNALLSKVSSIHLNDQIDQTRTQDSFWPGPPLTAERAISQARIHGSKKIFSFRTDIKDAFNTIHLNAVDAPINGSIVPNSNLGLISLVCTFGNGCSPGGFKAINIVGPLHRLGSLKINNKDVKFDCQFYCDDGNLIEPNIGTRLFESESWVRMLIDIVFGPDGINEGKTGIWTSYFRFLGFQWDLRTGTVTLPPDKLTRAKTKMIWLIQQSWVTNTQLLSTTGLLRHLATCCKPANALIQRLGGATSKYKKNHNLKSL